MPMPTPDSAPCWPVVTANGTAIRVRIRVTNGKDSLRCSSTRSGTTSTPLAESSPI